MKFFRASAPGLVALAVLLCCVPAFASTALDAPDADAPEAGEVLTNDSFAPSVPDNSTPAASDTVPDADSGGIGADSAPAVTAPGADSGGVDTDNAPADTAPDVGSDGVSSGVSGAPSVVECSGADITITLDDRAYASVTNVGGSVASASAADTSTLPGLLRAMFGQYTPRTQTVTTYFDGEPLGVSTEYVPGIAGMDMEWIASVVLFGIVVYCLFRLLGGVVR